jgi:amidohydrolase
MAEAAPDVAALKRAVCAAVDQMAPRLIELSHRIHDNPEFQYEEHRASAWLCEFLSSEGIGAELGACGMPTAFAGGRDGAAPGPTIAFVAEYDALRGLGHACGHNILGTSNVGAAAALARVMPQLAGRMRIYGTPAEEGGGGKLPFVRDGMFEGVDAAITMHPQGGARPHSLGGRCLASQPVTFKYYGKPAHAAANPQDGINALDACIQTFNNINALRQHLRQEVRIHGIIRHGGTAPNVTPEFAQAEFRVRAPSTAEAKATFAKVRACAEAGALAAGARLEVALGPFYEEMNPNAALGEAALANLQALGLPTAPPTAGVASHSTDLGNVSRVCPTVSVSVNIAGKGISPHQHEFADAAASADGDRGLLAAAKVMAMTAIDVLTDPALRQRAADELRRSQQS